ncbi:MAG: rhodanese-like domain-containing protein [Bacteroidetes bacterium]|nr:rhodanese-like domain-containing protein [Bacteroidota bacterium]
MLDTLKKLFGINSVDYETLVKNGAQILDVRTKGEYERGHIKNSINISVNQLTSSLHKLSKDKPIITCCASGMRSRTAKAILKSHGYTQVYNGGSWIGLQQRI